MIHRIPRKPVASAAEPAPAPFTPAETPAAGAVLGLAISAQEADLAKLERIFAQLNWPLRKVQSFREAMRALCSYRAPIIVCDRQLPDGNWKDLLSLIAPFPDDPRLIVMAASGQEALRAEVLLMGGYGVVSKQAGDEELVRLLCAAAPKPPARQSSGLRVAAAGD